MTSISKPSKQNSSTCIQCEMTKGEVSFGLAILQGDTKSPLPLLRQHHRLLYRNSHPLRSHLALLPLLLMRKDGSSPSCLLISWNRPPCPPSSTQKCTETWYVPINRLVQKSSSVLTDISLNCS